MIRMFAQDLLELVSLGAFGACIILIASGVMA